MYLVRSLNMLRSKAQYCSVGKCENGENNEEKGVQYIESFWCPLHSNIKCIHPPTTLINFCQCHLAAGVWRVFYENWMPFCNLLFDIYDAVWQFSERSTQPPFSTTSSIFTAVASQVHYQSRTHNTYFPIAF